MIDTLRSVVTGESLVAWLVIAFLVCFFIYKEWPELYPKNHYLSHFLQSSILSSPVGIKALKSHCLCGSWEFFVCIKHYIYCKYM